MIERQNIVICAVKNKLDIAQVHVQCTHCHWCVTDDAKVMSILSNLDRSQSQNVGSVDG